jgi:molybdate transport system substrate-binding protein
VNPCQQMKMCSKLMLLLCLLLLAFRVNAQTLRVAAAADLQLAMNDLARQFENSTGTKVAISYGSSGNFQAQIENGAPFDLFFSADTRYPEQLVKAGVADAQSLVVYAQGHLVLWAAAGENLELTKRGFEALEDLRVHKIAIANPEHAPYGRAAVVALKKAGLFDQVKDKLVYGENISQAAQFAQSRSAQVGIIALSLTFAESMKSGEKWEIPSDYYPPIRQEAVMINSSQDKTAATAFLGFVKGDAGRKILTNYGLTPPGAVAKP